MLATGVDLVEIARIARAAERHGERFRQRFFTEQELAYCQGRCERLAGRFAAKEAVAKALGTGIGDVGWKDIEVLCDARGGPYLLLHNGAAARAASLGIKEWSISLSHTDTVAIALAVALG
jgi:holo-[acyl-carrier protein] synthase